MGRERRGDGVLGKEGRVQEHCDLDDTKHNSTSNTRKHRHPISFASITSTCLPLHAPAPTCGNVKGGGGCPLLHSNPSSVVLSRISSRQLSARVVASWARSAGSSGPVLTMSQGRTWTNCSVGDVGQMCDVGQVCEVGRQGGWWRAMGGKEMHTESAECRAAKGDTRQQTCVQGVLLSCHESQRRPPGAASVCTSLPHSHQQSS